MAVTGIANYLISLKKGMTASACFKETQYPGKHYIAANLHHYITYKEKSVFLRTYALDYKKYFFRNIYIGS